MTVLQTASLARNPASPARYPASLATNPASLARNPASPPTNPASLAHARAQTSTRRKRKKAWVLACARKAGKSFGVALCALAAPAFAAPVELRPSPVDDDGRITLGELFEGAGEAASVQVGTRSGGSAVLDAGKLQLLARRAGLEWVNAQGLRRIIVRGPQAAPVTANVAAAPSVRALPVIRKDDAVTVRFERNGVSLTLQGKAMQNAAEGEPLSVLNPVSKKVVEAVAAGPGRAVVGPEADRLKALLYASR